MKCTRHWLLTALVGALLLPIAATAQEEQTTDTDDTFLDVVTVTATKREESLQEVPIAVTAVSELQMERTGMQDIRDLPKLAASFNMSASQTESQGSTLRIRGVGTTGNNIGLESAVGVFLDGVYLSRPGVALGDQLDVEAIEVLRGPQGTLFGRNVSAGALNIRTKKPSTGDTSAFANLTAGNFSSFNIQAGVTGGIVEAPHGLAGQRNTARGELFGEMANSRFGVDGTRESVVQRVPVLARQRVQLRGALLGVFLNRRHRPDPQRRADQHDGLDEVRPLLGEPEHLVTAA